MRQAVVAFPGVFLASGTRLAFSYASSNPIHLEKEATMTHIQPQVRVRRIPKLTAAWPQTPRSVPARAEAMLRDMAFVLHVTEAIKKSMLDKQHRVEETN